MDQLFKFSQRLFLREVYRKQADVFAFSEENLHFSYNTVCIMPLHHISKHDLLLVNYCAATAKKDKNNQAVAEQYYIGCTSATE